MNRVEIKSWAREKIKGHIWELLVPLIVAGFLTGLTIGGGYDAETGKYSAGMNLGIFFYFVQVGITWFMVKFITDKEHNFKDIFYFSKDYVRIFLVNLLQIIFIFLWTLLLIIPGIIKMFAYALVPFLLADEKYNGLGYRELLKKSEEIMKGHKMDYFVFVLSFIGWFLLVLFTLGLILIWLTPYFETAKTRFLNDIKTDYENKNGMSNSETQVPNDEKTSDESTEEKKCPECGTTIPDGSSFCPSCGKEV